MSATSSDPAGHCGLVVSLAIAAVPAQRAPANARLPASPSTSLPGFRGPGRRYPPDAWALICAAMVAARVLSRCAQYRASPS
ncbi:MAG: hypothetical protein WBL53_11780 [Pseudonocardiaceae bacterium]